MQPESSLLERLDRLERRNRWLTVGCALSLSVPLLSLVGWKSPSGQTGAPVELLKVKTLQVVDDRGVPLVTLGPDRLSNGGMITLRDKLGEKRSWWEVGPGTAALTLSSDEPSGSNDNTLGLAVGPQNTLFTLIGKSGSLMSAEVKGDGPHLDLMNDKGKSLFTAPWKGQ